jgi:hypothetical protein
VGIFIKNCSSRSHEAYQKYKGRLGDEQGSKWIVGEGEIRKLGINRKFYTNGFYFDVSTNTRLNMYGADSRCDVAIKYVTERKVTGCNDMCGRCTYMKP